LQRRWCANVAFQPGSFGRHQRDGLLIGRITHQGLHGVEMAASPLAACIFAMPVKYARLLSVNCGGKV